MIEKTINRKSMLLTVSASILSALAFHPIGLHFLAWFSFIPFLYAIEDLRPSAVFKSGIFFGFFFALFSVFWIWFVETPGGIKILMTFGLLVMFLYFGLYYGIASLFARYTGWYTLPFILSGMEFIRGIGEIGFPWLSFGYSQARYPLVIQQSSVYGIYGLSAWLYIVNLLLYRSIKYRKIKEIVILVITIVLPVGYGALRLSSGAPTEYVSIGVIQPNIDPNLKFTRGMREETFRRLIEFSTRCADQYVQKNDSRLDLIVWPDTAIPVNLRTPGRYQNRVIELAETLHVPILSGSPLLDNEERSVYNGAVLIVPDHGLAQEYRKLHLVPFGEHIPYEQYFDFLGQIDVSGGHYSPGTDYTLFRLNSYKFSCLICFESIFPDISRTYVAKGADFLLNITNDGWFGKISGSQQHNDMAIIRTVENNRSMARSANTGISMLVDNKGRVITESGVFVEAYLSGIIPISRSSTIYNRLGDFIPIISVILIPIMFIVKKYKRRVNTTTDIAENQH